MFFLLLGFIIIFFNFLDFYPVTRFLVTPLLVTALLFLVTPKERMMMMLMMMIMILMTYEWKASVWIGVFKKATQRPRQLTNNIENGGCSSVNYYKCVSLFFVFLFFFYSYKFPFHNYFMYFVAKKQNRTLAYYGQDGSR